MTNLDNLRPIMDVVLQFLEDEHWKYQVLENKNTIRTGYHGDHGTWVCYVRIDEENRRLIFYALTGMNIQPQNRIQVVEYLTRVNYGLPLGNFEMNLDTGDVRFKASVEVTGSELSIDMVRTLAVTCVRTIDHYFSGMMVVLHSGLSPASALARVDFLPVAIPVNGM